MDAGELDARFRELARRLDARGCTPDEIDRIERDQGVPLPLSYRIFLETMGRDVGGLYGGSAIAYHEVLGLREMALELIAEWNTDFRLPADAVVFFDHQGYQFMYLRAAEGNNPPVWWWLEGDAAQPKVVAHTLLELLEKDAASSTLPPEQKAWHRRSTAEKRRMRVIGPPPCPRCERPLTMYGSHMTFKMGYRFSGRSQQLGDCLSCGQSFWRWTDQPDSWHLVGTSQRRKWFGRG